MGTDCVERRPCPRLYNERLGGNGNCHREGESRVRTLVRVTPALCSSDYKSFTRTQNIRDGCAFLILEMVDG